MLLGLTHSLEHSLDSGKESTKSRLFFLSCASLVRRQIAFYLTSWAYCFFFNEQAIIADHQNFSPEEGLEFIRKMKVRQLEFETGFR